MNVTDVLFLRLKIDIYSRMFEIKAGREGFAQMFSAPLKELIDNKRLSKTRALRFDRDIEQFVCQLVADDKINEARTELRKLVGFDHLGLSLDSNKIVERVLRRARIADNFEAEIVRNFVSNLSNESLIGRAAFVRLASILDTAGY